MWAADPGADTAGGAAVGRRGAAAPAAGGPCGTARGPSRGGGTPLPAEPQPAAAAAAAADQPGLTAIRGPELSSKPVYAPRPGSGPALLATAKSAERGCFKTASQWAAADQRLCRMVALAVNRCARCRAAGDSSRESCSLGKDTWEASRRLPRLSCVSDEFRHGLCERPTLP